MANKPCLEPGCPSWAKPGRPRCGPHDKQWRGQRWENPAFKAWGIPHGNCSLQILCNGAQSDTWHHIDGDATNHRLDNRAPACRRCNSAEGGKPY